MQPGGNTFEFNLWQFTILRLRWTSLRTDGYASGRINFRRSEVIGDLRLKGSDRQSEVVELSMQYCAQIL